MVKVAHIIDSVQCPRCNGESKVVDSRDGETARRRRRQCLRCKNRYSTYEIHATEYEQIQTLKINMMQIDSAITVLQAIKAQANGDSNGHTKD